MAATIRGYLELCFVAQRDLLLFGYRYSTHQLPLHRDLNVASIEEFWIWNFKKTKLRVSKKVLNHGKFGDFFLVATGVVLNPFFPTKGLIGKIQVDYYLHEADFVK